MNAALGGLLALERMRPIVDDLFAGPGGWDVGHRLSDPHLREETYGFEWDDVACQTARAAGFVREQADVSKVDVRAHLALFRPRALLASPPCQGFSPAGKGRGREDSLRLIEAAHMMGDDPASIPEILGQLHHDMKDDRSVLALEPLRWALIAVEAGMPYLWIAWEQVPAVLPLWEACAEVLRRHGYQAEATTVQAEQYGVAQTRKRAIMRATLDPAGLRPLVPTHSRYHSRTPSRLDPGVRRWVTMAEALEWADDGRQLRQERGAGMIERHGDRPGRSLDQPAFTITGGDERKGGNVRQRWHFAGAGATAVDTSGQQPRDPDEAPAHTITTKQTAVWVPRNAYEEGEPVEYVGGNMTNSTRRPADTPAPTLVFGHALNLVTWQSPNRPDNVRVSAQEAAALQSFPPGYPWQGSKTQQHRQIGDAVPPLLARAVIESLRWEPQEVTP